MPDPRYDPDSDGISPEAIDLYLEEYHKHREAGDDPMNALLRIIEQGCPPDLARKIQASFGEGDEDAKTT